MGVVGETQQRCRCCLFRIIVWQEGKEMQISVIG